MQLSHLLIALTCLFAVAGSSLPLSITREVKPNSLSLTHSLVRLCICVSGLTLAADFSGSWTDARSGLGQVFCVSGSSFSGLYGEAGVYVGSVNGNQASGNYYEAGHHQPCAYGTFNFTLSNDGNSFTGFKVCEFLVVPVSETRTTNLALGSGNCGALSASSLFFQGHFNDSSNSISIDSCNTTRNDWFSSGQYVANKTQLFTGKSFEDGQLYEGGRVATGRAVWQDSISDFKVYYHVLHLQQANGVTSFYWCAPKSYSPIDFTQFGSSCHFVLTTTKVGEVLSTRPQRTCRRFITLETLISHRREKTKSSSSSSAIALVPSFAVLAAIVLAAVLF